MVKIKKKYLVLITSLALLIILVYINWNSISNLFDLLSSGSISDVTSLIKSFGIWAPLISIVLMVLQAFITPIPAFLITSANGVVFGVIGGIIVSWIGAMLGALGTFYLARYLGKDFVNKKEDKSKLIKKVDEISKEHGAKVIFIGRLLPFISFDFLSYAAGLSKIKTWQFLLATGVGMLPGTIAYVLLGNEVLKYGQYSIIILIIIFILLVIYMIYLKINKKH